MATILLSAAGAAVGASVGGSVLGLSAAVIGRAVGATVGRLIDTQLLGSGSRPVEVGRIDRFRLTGASEGAAIPQVHGRIRVGGQVIWASRFEEDVTTSGGGKGGPSVPETRTYSYTVNLAVALCEGPISRVGRVWADGVEVSPADLGMRVYTGAEDQLPDPKIEAVEGAGSVPAYRGIAYVVFEDLAIGQFGNRVPQFSFEVVRVGGDADLADVIRAVAVIPGSGEYALATTPVRKETAPGVSTWLNVNSASGKSDFETSLDALSDELPKVGASSLVVSWFGDDLRCGDCRVVPKVEEIEVEGIGQPWRVAGETRQTAGVVDQQEGRPIYGGTPGDDSVLEAIAALNAAGQAVMFYPFLLMEQVPGNTLIDPWTGKAGQPALPWRGRITTSLAPTVTGSPDGTAAAEAEVAAFFGVAEASDFLVSDGAVSYTGPSDTGFRRFILHYAHLCALAGGVDSFCIGSEMRGLTQIRGAGGSFPAVAEFVRLAADVRGILGPSVKIGYAADWSEYFGYQPQDGSGDVYFHLDPLWADANIDFIGIDNYMPLSDWRDGGDHLDAGEGAIYSQSYLTANVAGGEGFDWYYASEPDEAAQVRTPITDGAHDEPWIYRYKDLKNWWQSDHHERIGGTRQATSTAWVPESKPIWFTEYGCAAIDKGANQPNRFLDPKSSESKLPRASDGARDDAMQLAYYRAHDTHWNDPDNNPKSALTNARMVDTTRLFAWAWDARPYPQFPGAVEVWSDGDNYARGHWLTGRSGARSVASVVREVCTRAGVSDVDVSGVYGVVRGYAHEESSGARSILQPIMLAHGLDAIETGGALVFQTRSGRVSGELQDSALAWPEGDGALFACVRDPAAETADRLQATFIEADADFDIRAAESIVPDEVTTSVAKSEVPLVLTPGEAEALVERWLGDARSARDRISFAMAPSATAVAGDVVTFSTPELSGRYRIDKVEDAGLRLVDAVRVDGVEAARRVAGRPRSSSSPTRILPPVPVWAQMLNLPLLRGDEVPDAPFVAATAVPWPGDVAVYGSDTGEGWRLEGVLSRPATMGRTLSALSAADAGIWDRGPGVEIELSRGALASASDAAVFAGGNAIAIGDGDAWEVLQFANATPTGASRWSVSRRLRGQRGTRARAWPAGSIVVVLDDALSQPDSPGGALGRERLYRIGPATRPVSDSVFTQVTHTATAAGLTPFPPAHLSAARAPDGALQIRWVRQTRIDGDRWDLADVPLGEAREAYDVRVIRAGETLREARVDAPTWVYGAAAQASDGATGTPFEIEVAQVSDRVGPGRYERIQIDG